MVQYLSLVQHYYLYFNTGNMIHCPIQTELPSPNCNAHSVVNYFFLQWLQYEAVFRTKHLCYLEEQYSQWHRSLKFVCYV